MSYEVNIEVTTPEEIIEKDRKKYENMVLKPDRDRWILKIYGDKLDVPAEDIYEQRLKVKDFYCRICKEIFEIDEKFVHLNLNFCDGYDHGMNIHLELSTCLYNRGIEYDEYG